MKLVHHAVTDVGRKRKGNEDSYFVNGEQRLFVVADGMGGHAAGEVASRIAVESINEFVCLTRNDEPISLPEGSGDSDLSSEAGRLRTAVLYSNEMVLETTRQRAEYEGMATTVAALLVDDSNAHLAHVGDSRVYLYRRPHLKQITSDHSWVNEQVETGILTAEQARVHPLRNVVTRALGGRPDLVVDVATLAARPGDLLLLCSDGLTTMVTDEEIKGILDSHAENVPNAAKELVAAANARGGEDNITVVLVQFRE